jgi:hypothetical protein
MTCDECGCSNEDDGCVITLVEDEFLCDACFIEKYFICEYCGEFFLKEEMSDIKDTCKKCAE